MASLGIIGAGASGLAAAWALRRTPIDVTIFEKSRGYSGRAATRRREETRYDHGANYIKPTNDRVDALLTEHLPTDELEDIGNDIWTFDRRGTVSAGDPASNAAPKWTYRRGIHTVGKLLAAEAEATVHLETRVASVEATDDRWEVVDTDAARWGPFDAVLLTPPAPQTADLIRASVMPSDLRATLIEGCDAAAYTSQFSFILAYDRLLSRPEGVYAFVNTDKEHPIAWMSFEDDKPGHVPDGASVLVVQMAPDWTTARLNLSPDAMLPDVIRLAGDVLDEPLASPAWTDAQRWRYALPTQAADTDTLAEGIPHGLFFAGDAIAGKGRVGEALETGLAVAERIQNTLLH
jgi:predicted NAD/FAD-dependent oxidoreductase